MSPAGASPGVIDAPDRASAVRLLIDRGITPRSVRAQDGGGGGGGGGGGDRRSDRGGGGGGDGAVAVSKAVAVEKKSASGGAVPRGGSDWMGIGGERRVSRARMASLMGELATAINAGLPLVQALATLRRAFRNEGDPARRMLDHLIGEVEHGRSFAEAAQSWGKPFGELTIGMIRAGEASGRLGQVLAEAAKLLERDQQLRRSLMNATLYPLILLGLVSVSVVIVVTVIVPRVLAPLAGRVSASDLPLPTRMVTGVADVVGSYWWALLLGVGFVVFWFSRWRATAGGRMAIDRAMLGTPVVGRLVRDVAVARFTRTFATLLGAGLPVLTSLRITRATLGNAVLEEEIERAGDDVAHGASLSEPLDRCGRFPPLLTQIVSVGERTGRLAEMLSGAAEAMEQRTQQSLKVVSTVLPPMLVVVLAVVVGFVIAAVILPLLELQEYIDAM